MKRRREQKEMEEILNKADFADNMAEYELQVELRRTGTKNDPIPKVCPHCGGELKNDTGLAGENVLFCEEHGPVWFDNVGAIRNVF